MKPIESDKSPADLRSIGDVAPTDPRAPTRTDGTELQFAANITDETFRAAYRQYWWHDWPQYAVATGIVLPAFTALWCLGFLPNAAWLLPAVVAAGLSIYLVRDYYRCLNANLGVRRQLADHAAEFRVCGESLQIRTHAGTAVVPRNNFKGVLCATDYLILLLAGVCFIIVPTHRMSADERRRFESWLADVNPN